MPASEPTPRDALPTRHAGLVLAAWAVTAVVGHPWPLVLGAALSFAWLVAGARGRFTPDGRFGSANAVTALRLVLVLSLGLALHGAGPLPIVVLTLTVLTLDAFDGWLARRSGLVSSFGALFDVEVDSLLVLVLAVELWQRGRFGGWILWPGLLRYAYVLVLSAWPSRGGPAPRSLIGRIGFGLLVASLLAGLVFGDPLGVASAALGSAFVTLSFARSFYLAYAPSAR